MEIYNNINECQERFCVEVVELWAYQANRPVCYVAGFEDCFDAIQHMKFLNANMTKASGQRLGSKATLTDLEAKQELGSMYC